MGALAQPFRGAGSRPELYRSGVARARRSAVGEEAERSVKEAEAAHTAKAPDKTPEISGELPVKRASPRIPTITQIINRKAPFEKRAPLIKPQGAPEALRALLRFHGAPENALDAHFALERPDELADIGALLRGALEARKAAAPLDPTPTRPLMLVGAPGSGHAMAAARLALRCKERGRETLLICADAHQPDIELALRCVSRASKVDFLAEPDPEGCAEQAALNAGERMIILCGPFIFGSDGQNQYKIKTLVNIIGAELVLTCSALTGYDFVRDIVTQSVQLGARRAIATHIDGGARLAGAMSLALDPRLSIAGLSYGATGAGRIEECTVKRLCSALTPGY